MNLQNQKSKAKPLPQNSCLSHEEEIRLSETRIPPLLEDSLYRRDQKHLAPKFVERKGFGPYGEHQKLPRNNESWVEYFIEFCNGFFGLLAVGLIFVFLYLITYR